LLPGILKAVVSNGAQHKQSRFSEIAPVWQIVQETQEIKETLSLAFVINDSTISFHQGKSIVDLVFQLCGKKATWMQCTRETAPFWLTPFESAALMIEKKCVGHAGMLQEMIHKKMGKDVAKRLFVVHLSLDALVAEGSPLSLTVPSKYQSVHRDITFWVPKTCPAATVVETARANTEHITSIKQLSFLEKEEWDTHRALTVRCTIGSSEKTFTTEEIDTVVETIIQKVHQLGVTVK
jgi:phenylalanyl-tRNA synthetase beta subunit